MYNYTLSERVWCSKSIINVLQEKSYYIQTICGLGKKFIQLN